MGKDNLNLAIWEASRKVPQEALKTIMAGRIKGFSDINPVWRCKCLTEQFGPCGIGWKYTITKQWSENYGNEVRCFCNIDLFIKYNGEWSDAIPGTGGSSLVSLEKSGLFYSDEGYKMALTDALSVAMKALGVGADIYFSKDAKFDSKYEVPANYMPTQNAQQQSQRTAAPIQQPAPQAAPPAAAPAAISEETYHTLQEMVNGCTTTEQLTELRNNVKIIPADDKRFRDMLNARYKQLFTK